MHFFRLALSQAWYRALSPSYSIVRARLVAGLIGFLMVGFGTNVANCAVGGAIKGISTPADTESVLSRLATIRDGYRHGREAAKSFRLTGFEMPGSLKFVLTQKDGKGRFETDVVQPSGRLTCYRLDTGEAFLSLTDDSLIMLPGIDHLTVWRSLTRFPSFYEAPLYNGKQRDVAELCQFLIDLIKGTAAELAQAKTEEIVKDGGCVIAINPGPDGSEVVELSAKGEPAPIQFRMYVNPHQGYSLVRWENFDGAYDPTEWQYKLVTENRFREIAGGICMLSSGTTTTTESGTTPRKSNREGTTKSSIRVDRAEIGDFDIDANAFSIDSLPIKAGTLVRDERVDPSYSFIYKEGPVDENILLRAQKDRPQSEPHRFYWRTLLIGVNVVIVLCVVVFLALRRWRARR